MRITIDFENWDEMEAFRTSGKKTRTKKEEEAEQPQPQQGGQPVMPTSFAPPQVAVATGFPGANGASPPQNMVHPLVPQIIKAVDGALATGQSVDMMTNWFRNLLGPDTTQATLDQIKTIFIPRLSEPQLKQIAIQIGIKE